MFQSAKRIVSAWTSKAASGIRDASRADHELAEVGSARSAVLSVAALSVFLFLLYLQTIHYALVFDDTIQIVGNHRLTSWSYLPGYFTTHLWAHRPGVGKWYRPIFLVWLRFCYVLFGPPSNICHLPAILTHMAATAWLFMLIRQLTGNLRSAIVSAAIFGIHPIHTEAVAWISAVEDPLVTIFLLSCLYFFAVRKGPISFLSLLCALLAMLTKEVGVMAVCLIFAYEWIHSSLKRAVPASIPYLICTAFYFALRFNALGGVTSGTQKYMSLAAMVMTWPRLIAYYLLHLLWPVHLSVVYDVPPGTSIWPVLLLAVLVVLSIWKLREADSTIQFGAAWFAITMLPSLAIWYFDGDFLHDRYLYLPSAGLAMILSSLLARMRFKPSHVILCAIAAGALCLVTLHELPVWHDEISLYERAIQSSPRNTHFMSNLALDYTSQGRYADAIRMLRHAIDIDPKDPVLYINLGFCYRAAGDTANADSALMIAKQLSISSGNQGTN
jgi:hypothetical protein